MLAVCRALAGECQREPASAHFHSGHAPRRCANCADKSCVKTTLHRAAKAPSTWEHQSPAAEQADARLQGRQGCGDTPGSAKRERQILGCLSKGFSTPQSPSFYKCTKNVLLGAGWCSQEVEGSL